MTLHIAFVTPRTARLLLSGAQVCESRLSVARHPARAVAPGDRLLIKAGDGLGLATVARVEVYEDLRPEDVAALADLYGPAVDGPDPDPAYWAAKARARHAVFLWLAHVSPLPAPVPRALLPSTQSAWVRDYRPSPDVTRYLP